MNDEKQLIERILTDIPKDVSCIESLALYYTLDKTFEQFKLYRNEDILINVMKSYYIERTKYEHTQG